ncbi:MAG TPA: Eco57I restriction-modification methylase domain-containing protein [Flavobacteriaceae bacterium]|nr:Eco57I restriction-modification methylase domain-containing protein [Flavobacteriaceae bacterium]
MNIQELRQLLQEPYSTENWRDLLVDVFENVQFLNPPTVIPTDDDRVRELRQYGTIQLSDGKNLALFEMSVNEDKVRLLHNRVGLNELVRRYIDQDSYHGILSVFDEGSEDYRFTFTARNTDFDEEEGFIDRATDPKRLTYILGKNQSCRTPAERFLALKNTENQSINAVEEAFNVEKLSKKFFNEYIAQFDKLVNYIKSKPNYYQAIFENKETPARNFVKQFMGRLVFLKFVQKKGWLGVPVNEEGWDNGDYNFLENQYRNFEHKGIFVSIFLNPLFFEALNTGERENDEFQDRGYKIPYLSGGLFENDYPEANRIDFPEEYLTELFQFFERYNFTIDENDVNDKEVGIDPEMLGHIFENLLEDNKDKGAFYTPKEIVRYMSQESLKEYLKTYLEKEKLWPTEETEREELKDTLTAFVEKKETARVARYDKEIATALKEVKICDPAIGSGAFPMGLLNEIFTLTKYLHEESPERVGRVWGMLGDAWNPHTVKLNIIQNSIYGVDIEPGAVDIARLRFWLSLVIEEDTPQPLPHLDYKIVVGDSLVSKLDDTIIDIDWSLKAEEQTDMFGNSNVERNRELLLEITELQKEFFEPNSDEGRLANELRDKKIELLINQLELMVKTKGLEEKPTKGSKSFSERTELWLTTKGWKNQIKNLKTKRKNRDVSLKYFDWLLDFPIVMNPAVNPNPGFDIVIGNPPYLGDKGNKNVFRPIMKSKFGEKYYKGQMDLFYYFFHKGIDLLKPQAHLTFITTNYFITANGAIKLRKDLKKRTTLKKLINFNELRIFETALGQHNLITSFQKNHSPDSNVKVSVAIGQHNFSLETVTKFLNKELDSANYYVDTNQNIYETTQEYIRILTNSNPQTLNSIFDKILFNTKKLGDEYIVNAGIGVTISKITSRYINNYPELDIENGDGVFVVNNHEAIGLESDVVKDFVKNSDIGHYQYELNEDKLIYLTRKDDINAFPKVKKHLLKFKEILKDQIVSYEEVFPWYALNRPRVKEIFESEDKIILPYRAKSNKFAYSNEPIYGSRDVLFIRKSNSGQNIKCLLALLNSKLFYFWLYNKGKRKGEILEMVQTPISEIPIKQFSKQHTALLSSIVERILKEKSNVKVIDELIEQIDNIIYKLYNLEYKEALIVEPELSERLTEEEYNAIEV